MTAAWLPLAPESSFAQRGIRSAARQAGINSTEVKLEVIRPTLSHAANDSQPGDTTSSAHLSVLSLPDSLRQLEVGLFFVVKHLSAVGDSGGVECLAAKLCGV